MQHFSNGFIHIISINNEHEYNVLFWLTTALINDQHLLKHSCILKNNKCCTLISFNT